MLEWVEYKVGKIKRMDIKIKEVKPQIWNFKIQGGSEAWKEVAYSARMSGVPPQVGEEDIFRMILRNDYTSGLRNPGTP